MSRKPKAAEAAQPAGSTTYYYKRHGGLLPAHLWKMGRDGSNRPDLECEAGDAAWRPYSGGKDESHEQ